MATIWLNLLYVEERVIKKFVIGDIYKNTHYKKFLFFPLIIIINVCNQISISQIVIAFKILTVHNIIIRPNGGVFAL